MGYKQCNGDHIVFYKHSRRKITVLAVYVDDIIITGDDEMEIKCLKGNLSREFEVKDLGQLKYFLGIEIARNPKAEAEYRAMSLGLCEMLWVRNLLSELNVLRKDPLRIWCDNKSAISIANNPVRHDKTKHVEIDRFFIKEKLDDGILELSHGVANAVGLALAEKHLAARFNKPDSEIVDHYTYVILGDGCQMEGVANEACSLAGHWGLGKLIAFYDDNHISIDGDTEIAFTEDVSTRFEALGWHIIWVKSGNTGYDEIRAAIKEAKAVTDKPTLIKVTTTIGFGSPNKANSYSVHGSALGSKEAEATRQNLGWPYEPFFVPEDVKSFFECIIAATGAATRHKMLHLRLIGMPNLQSEKKYADNAATLNSLITGEFPTGWADALSKYTPESPADATRNLSQQCLNAIANVCLVLLEMFGDFQKDTPEERNVRFGVREHGMGAIANGIALHSPGFVPYCATFFVFTDYMRGAMRISALSQAGVIYVMTHDSIGLGEDGPTHQPIEHLEEAIYSCSLKAKASSSAWHLNEGVEKGGYTISDNSTGNKPDLIVLSTGSELEIAAKAADELRKEGKTVRVVSFVSWELFEEQSVEYKESVLPEAVTARISIEAGSTLGWQKYIGAQGKAIGIDKFGASAPAGKIYKEYGITVEGVIAAAKSF
ncbi:unnamed protein product [Miscanthus lutarioriparius]|uniref:transketolase n=1 Tax=Miscanthus lutarioriparius TaxID=422564 RepID=A0A811RX01_9POAL|nr:unnamed protein product [Miscanthus lutarioriparius]